MLTDRERKRLEQEREALVEQFRGLGNLMRGTVIQVGVTCGRAGCGCERGEKHRKVHLSVNLGGRCKKPCRGIREDVGGSGPPAGVLCYRLVSAGEAVYFEDIRVGEEYSSPGRTVTEADIVIFAGLSGDYNVLHTDAEHMKASLLGERIAHGLLGLSIQQGLLSRDMPAWANESLAGLRWKFKGPIKIGDTIHVRARVAAKKDGPGPRRGTVSMARTVLNQRGEVVQEGETEHAVERRDG